MNIENLLDNSQLLESHSGVNTAATPAILKLPVGMQSDVCATNNTTSTNQTIDAMEESIEPANLVEIFQNGSSQPQENNLEELLPEKYLVCAVYTNEYEFQLYQQAVAKGKQEVS
jgi:hypothetical protein